MVSNFVSVLCVMAAVAVASGSPAGNEAERAIGKSTEEFAVKIYQQMKSEPGNLLICPVSAQTVLALVQAGAHGDTSSEMQRVLSLPEDKQKTQAGFHQLMQSFLHPEKVTMDIANRIFVKEGYKIKDSFKEIATRDFLAGVENIDFTKSAVAARRINGWVEQITHDKIKDLISPNDLSDLTRMVLVNALYFKGNWVHSFDKYATSDKNFYAHGKTAVKVPMMHQTSSFNYAENAELDCKFLEMRYEGNQYAMTIVLPNARDGLPALEQRIGDVLKPQQYSMERVQVELPKFTMETTIKMDEVLNQLGMENPFSDSADFSGLLDTAEKLKISKVIQKNFINVTEEGTEAASATAVGVVGYSMPPPPTGYFLAKHPFVFCLHSLTNPATVLFIGRYQGDE